MPSRTILGCGLGVVFQQPAKYYGLVSMLRRTLRISIFFVLASVVAAVAAIQVQQHLLGIRAERLLSDIRALELRKSTWSDAQKVFTHWGAWGHYDGSCVASKCDYQIELGDFFFYSRRRFVGTFIPFGPWARRAYGFLGLRPIQVNANVLVRDCLVWGKGFSLFVEVPPELGPSAPFGGNGYTLIGSSQSVSRFVPAGYWPQLVVHPEYTVMTPGGCTGCLSVDVRFTPFADPSDVARLMDFNLSCLTRRKPCRDKADIMPSAWRQYIADGKARDSALDEMGRCAYPLELRARDTDNAIIVNVVSNRTEKGVESFQVSTVRLVKKLKAASFWENGATREVRVFSGTVSLTSANMPEDVSPGGRFIMLFHRGHWAGPSGPEVWLDRCGLLPLTDVNLKAVRRGIEHDFESSVPPE